MPQKTSSIVRVGRMGLIVLLSGHAASSQGFAGDAGVRALSRGLATTTSSTTSTTNTCPDEAQACLNDTTCAECFQKPESTSCVNGFLLGDDLTCEDVFSGFFCCQWGDEDSCVDNALLRDVFGCNAALAGCTLAESCSSESATTDAATTDAATTDTDSAADTEEEAETETETETEAETGATTAAGMSVGRSGAAAVLGSTAVVTGLLAVVLDTLL